ncbi:tRNA lysidine(34) synthetase TilS [Serratia quinivorans]|uniref:tRNA lysidine(34) synthetase TilS n=1 Tax=Serratia quinivorans TaxID=137545 RepID=UPI00217C5B06|nr:tRNA lysidine(34) synthetase TilS [Serratia quinivorans]CAI0956125.1 tRNA(Ile)-lysidine synthase [Serratia quinivorans]CAI1225974.1 tRNA(Ile)-lysidine synthase [Serratia quinivorans]CAI2153036.1 tRNA(Ile)-lysidine synthase [Serratia quinivorans]
MNNNQLSAQLARHLGAHRHLLVAFSGGLDSSVLLHLLVGLRQQLPDLQLRAVHVHHGLSAFADQWVTHCRQQCVAWQLPLVVQYVQVDSQQGGIEAAARAARYSAFASTLAADETLLTAQHLDDQCETFLLALKRGSGPAGLSAMAAQTSLGDNHLLRPLLGYSRQQLEAYAQQHQLSWIEDDSNQDPRFDRNFLRLQVLPLLNQRWPHFAAATARSASLCAEQEQLLDELLAEQLHKLLDEDHALAIDGLVTCSPARRFALLRRWIALFGVTMPSREQLQRLWEEVALSREDAEPQLQLGQYQFRRFRRRLYLLPLMADLREISLSWSMDDSLVLPDGLGELVSGEGDICLRAPQSQQKVSIRFTAQGKHRILGRAHSRPIKKLWQELGIPPWQRERTPLIYYDDQLIAALGIFVSEAGQTPEGQQPWRLHWRKK